LTEEEKRGSRGRRNKPQQASTPARQDAADGDGVEVTAFTEFEGRPGPVELSGKVKLGDKVARVNGQSTRGLDFAAVLEMIIDAPRPLTLHWERTGSRPQDASRVAHSDFKPIATGP